jgi:hypothetical protein
LHPVSKPRAPAEEGDKKSKMRRSYLEQYRGAGRFGDLIWSAIYSEGTLEEGTPLWNDAYAVAREAMVRVRQNVEIIVDFLLHEHYLFFGIPPNQNSGSADPWLPPGPETSEQLQRLTTLAGALPLSLRAWWEIVGTVSLQGVFEDLRGVGSDSSGWQVPMGDPLMVAPLDYVLQQVEEQLAEGIDPSGQDSFVIDIAPDIFHKADQSGGAPYTVHLPDQRFDTPLHNVCILLPAPPPAGRPFVEVETNETFGQYLHRSFQWAGFPGFAFLPHPQVERIRPLFHEMLPI